MTEKNFLLIGSPGSGKGTQAVKLVEKKSLVHLSTGDLFRENLKKETDMGLLAKSYMNKGLLVPDQVTNSMVSEFMKTIPSDKGVIFDGFPRNLSQATALEEILDQHGKKLSAVVFLKVPDREVVERLTGRLYAPKSGVVYHVKNKPPKQEGICDVSGEALITRPDDTEKVIKSRLAVFHKETSPLLSYYDKRGLMHTIDAGQSPDQVLNSILHALGY